MADYKITCSSTIDMPSGYLEERDIPYTLYHFTMSGREYPDDFGKTMPITTFYKMIDDGAMPTTSQVNTSDFVALFEPILESGRDVLHIEMSSGISGTINSANAARDDLVARYPDRKLYIVDSLAASSGYGLLVDAAWEHKQSGMDIDKLLGWLENNKLKLHHWFFTTDLTHFKRGGRVSAASAAVGGLLNICPLLNVNYMGQLIPRSKIRGKKHVSAEMVEKMKRHADSGTGYSGKCFMSNSDRRGDAEYVASLITDEFQRTDGSVLINSIGAVIGAHTGPGTVALFFWGDKRVD